MGGRGMSGIPMSGRFFIGTSGWHYPHWRGVFYPARLPAEQWLAHYALHFDTVEINRSFYRLPGAEAVAAWRGAVPAGFRFAVKASRYITHMKKLKDPRDSLAAFRRVARGLGRRLGPVLFQLPPNWRVDPGRLAGFLAALPRSWRCAFELRDPSWHCPEVYALLRRHPAAFCIYDLGGFTAPPEMTADFAYLRLHGAGEPYAGRYGTRRLRDWAAAIRGWGRAGDVYVYFDNDEAGYAVADALELRRLLG
jgi:uncharacterized protein YecE (DUF72 family)